MNGWYEVLSNTVQLFLKETKMKTSNFKDLVKSAKLNDFIWWIFLVFVTFFYPIYSVYMLPPADYNGILIENKEWLYICAIVVWDIFLAILIMVLLFIGLIFSKIAIWIYKD